MKIILIILIIVIIVFGSLTSWFYFSNIVHQCNDFFSGIVGSVIVSLLTAILIWIAYYQLKSLFQTTNADFIHKLKNDFFKEETRKLFHLVEHDYILFREGIGDSDKCRHVSGICEQHKTDESEKEYFFEVNCEKIEHSGLPKEIQQVLLEKKFYSSYELDDFLLGHFEDIGLFETKGVIDIEMVYEEFSWYLKASFENCQIQKYMEALGEDFYDKFKYVYKKSESYSEIKEANKAVWLWKIKYHCSLS
jgi:hypothetical protein